MFSLQSLVHVSQVSFLQVERHCQTAHKEQKQPLAYTPVNIHQLCKGQRDRLPT